MRFELTTLIANRMASARPAPAAADTLAVESASISAAAGTATVGSTISAAHLPVLQLASLPIALTPTLYANPFSGSNPGGTMASLYAFRLLVDPVPSFTEYYSPGANSTETLYDNVVHGAAASADAGYTQRVLSSAQRTFDTSGFAGLDGSPYTWQPVYATPGDWYDVAQSSRFISMDLDVSAAEAAAHSYTVLGAGQPSEQLSWQIGDNAANATSVPLGTDTTLQGIHFKYLEVNLTRQWLDFEIFGLKDWYLQGQSSGYCSTGNADDNDGVLPLLPTGLIIGIDTSVTANWSEADQNLMAGAVSANKYLSLGPFVLQTGTEPVNSGANLDFQSRAIAAAPQTLYVVGWLSSLVPLSPALTSQ